MRNSMKFIIIIALLLAFANGANDNAKGVATLIGAASGQAHWKTITKILAAWIITLPLATTIGFVARKITTHLSNF